MKRTVAADQAGTRIDAWLVKHGGARSRPQAHEWIERGKVFLNGGEVAFDRAGVRVQAGDEVAVWMDRPGSSRPQSRDIVSRRSSLRVVFEDGAMLVADKPPGVLVEPLPGEREEVTLRDLVEDHLKAGRDRAGHGETLRAALALVVHRIDRDTSGLVLFAKHEQAQVVLKRQFERRTAERVYLAVLLGRLSEPEGRWRDLLVWDKVRLVQRRASPDERESAQATRKGKTGGGTAREAIASYRIVEQFADAALVEVRLATGKRNQIRIQAALRGHPLAGERIYTSRTRTSDHEAPRRSGSISFGRQALHAARLTVRHPETGARMEFRSPLPQDMQRLIEKMKR